MRDRDGLQAENPEAWWAKREIERLREEIERLNRIVHGVCAWPNCTCPRNKWCATVTRAGLWPYVWRGRSAGRLPFWRWFRFVVTGR